MGEKSVYKKIFARVTVWAAKWDNLVSWRGTADRDLGHYPALETTPEGKPQAGLVKATYCGLP